MQSAEIHRASNWFLVFVSRLRICRIFARGNVMFVNNIFTWKELTRLFFATLTANTYTRKMSHDTKVLFVQISSAWQSFVAYYSYLELKWYVPASYICNIVNETTSPSTRWDGMRWPLVPRMILPRIRKRVKDRYYRLHRACFATLSRQMQHQTRYSIRIRIFLISIFFALTLHYESYIWLK